MSCGPLGRTEDMGFCMMMGDASNDAEAIGLEGVVGISLKHGAAPCRLGADFIVTEPGALVPIRTELHTRALAGAKYLLEDVCHLCGLLASLTLCGVWSAGFKFLPRGFLYDDPFDAGKMTLFSSCLYLPSSCTAACAVVAQTNPDGTMAGSTRAPRVSRSLILGVVLGSCFGLAGPSNDGIQLGRWILTCTSSISLIRHVFAGLRMCSWGNSVAANGSASTQFDACVLDGSAACAALGAPNVVARTLGRAKELWVRGLALGIYLLIVRL